MKRLSDVEPERVSWLWPGRIPLGKLVTVDGDPGLGKSTLSTDIGARTTTGTDWPDGSPCGHPGAVLVMSAEDGLADTVRPRFDAAGADVAKVYAIEGVPIITEDGTRVLRPPTMADVVGLEEAITQTGARLLIIDVVMAYLPTGVDAHKDQDIRRVLAALSALADKTSCTVLMLRHLNKASGRDPLYRGGGSIGIVGAARAGLLVARDPEDEDLRILASVKSNLGPAAGSLSYRLVDAPQHGCARIEWEGTSNHTAHTVLAEPHRDDDDELDTRDYTNDLKQSWLYQYLEAAHAAKHKVRPKDAVSYGSDRGHSRRTVFRLFGKLQNAEFARSIEGTDFPRATYWEVAADGHTPKQGGTTGTTGDDQAKHGGTTALFSYDSGTTEETGHDQPEHAERPPVVPCSATDSPNAGNVTYLGSRKSPETGRRKLSAQKWFNRHIDELREAGHTTAESFAVYGVGEAAGYTRGNLSQAARNNPDIVLIDRTNRGATWSITGDRQSAYIPATEFFADYLARLPAGTTVIDQDDYRREARAAGYAEATACKAATKHPRVESVPAYGNSTNQRIWQVLPDEEAS
jgi:hypothetical protein